MMNQSLPDGDHISRYCKPSTIDEFGLPLASAFSLRQGEEHLSVNWLGYFRERNLSDAVKQVREAFSNKNYRVRANGRFAVLNVGEAKKAVQAAVGHALRIEHLPSDNDRSHAGIFGYTANDLVVAIELKALVTSQDVHPAVA